MVGVGVAEIAEKIRSKKDLESSFMTYPRTEFRSAIIDGSTETNYMLFIPPIMQNEMDVKGETAKNLYTVKTLDEINKSNPIASTMGQHINDYSYWMPLPIIMFDYANEYRAQNQSAQ